ncbi:uncharacterized protein LOC144750502 [Ciona intestinalis]
MQVYHVQFALYTIVPGSGYFNTNTFTIVSCDITVGAIESNTNLTTQSSVEQTANLLQIVTSAINLTSHEITSVATLIDDITISIQRNNFSVNTPLLHNIALTMSHISATLRTQTIATNSSFVKNLDFFARKVETNGTSPVQMQTNQLQIEVTESSRDAPTPTSFAGQFLSTWVVNISLPLEAIQRAWEMNIGSKLRTIFVCHRDSALFPTNNKPGMVMSADFGVKGRIMNLKNPVTIEFVGLNTTHGRRKEGGKNYFVNQRCVFWDFATSDWSSEGCRLDVTKHPPTQNVQPPHQLCTACFNPPPTTRCRIERTEQDRFCYFYVLFPSNSVDHCRKQGSTQTINHDGPSTYLHQSMNVIHSSYLVNATHNNNLYVQQPSYCILHFLQASCGWLCTVIRCISHWLSTTTSIVNTGDTFPMSLEIRNVNLTLNQANVSLSCSPPGCTTQVNLHVKAPTATLINIGDGNPAKFPSVSLLWTELKFISINKIKR